MSEGDKTDRRSPQFTLHVSAQQARTTGAGKFSAALIRQERIQSDRLSSKDLWAESGL